MNNDKSESTDREINSHSDFAIADFEIDYGSVIHLKNKKEIRKAVKDKYIIMQKLDLINEKRSLDRQLNSFSHYWDI